MLYLTIPIRQRSLYEALCGWPGVLSAWYDPTRATGEVCFTSHAALLHAQQSLF